jgi:glycerol uptake facilitator-like aquaporin
VVDRATLRRASAEAVGTGLLVATVVGSGIAAQRLARGEPALELLATSLATGAVLVALILALGPISGAHLNPVVTLADRLLGGITTRQTSVYVAAQLGGACLGAIVANLMFDLPAITVSTHERSGPGLLLGEALATFGLVVVVLGVVRSGKRELTAVAVGTYIMAAYWFTSSTSFANPAVTVARTLSNTFAGIAPSDVPPFVAFQILGGVLAVALVRYWKPGVDAAGLAPHEQLHGG